MVHGLVMERQDCEVEEARMTPAALAVRCREETARYRRGEPHEERFAVELFRRAIVVGDDASWSELYSLYYDQVLVWCRRAVASREDTPDELVSAAWIKFWHSYTAEKLAAGRGLPAVLYYLQMCARSAALDVARVRLSGAFLREAPADLDEDTEPFTDGALDAITGAELWQEVDRHLRGEQERVAVHLRFLHGLRSAEIQVRRPDLFPTVREVYRVSRNAMERLRRSAALREWCELAEV